MTRIAKRKCCIYLARHMPSQRVYIGLTGNFAVRQKAHRVKVGQSPVADIIKREGKDSFEWEILKDNLSPQRAISLEKKYIRKYMACDAAHGLNKSTGGFSVAFLTKSLGYDIAILGIRLTLPQRQALAEAARGEDRPDATMARKYIVQGLIRDGWLKVQKARGG